MKTTKKPVHHREFGHMSDTDLLRHVRYHVDLTFQPGTGLLTMAATSSICARAVRYAYEARPQLAHEISRMCSAKLGVHKPLKRLVEPVTPQPKLRLVK
jgi:hypothetical protein